MKKQQQTFMVPGAGTMMVGCGNVSQKLAALAQYMLWDMPDFVAGEDAVLEHNVLMVAFDVKQQPIDAESQKPVLSYWYPDTHTICLYLRNILDDVWGVVKTRKNRCSVGMLIWNVEVKCLLHELRHSQFLLAAGDEEVPNDVLEKDAEEWVEAMMIHLAKNVDIEPPTLADMPWIGAQVMGRFVEAVKEPRGSAWVGLQQQMLEHKLLYLSIKGNKTVKSLREFFMKKALDGGAPPAEWEVKPLAMAFTASPLDVMATAIQPAGPPPPPFEAAQPAGPPPPPAETGPMSTFCENSRIANSPIYMEDDDDGYEEIDYGAADGPQEVEETNEEQQPKTNNYNPQPPPKVVPNNLTPDQIGQVIHAVYTGCWTHIFTKCGQLINSDQGFNNPGAILEKISFAHIPGFDNIVTHIDASVQNTQTGAAKWTSQVPVTNGQIWGHVSKNNMPMYSLYINVNGVVIRRLLMPANPTSSGKLGRGARQGERHLLVMDGDKPNGAPGAVVGVVSTGVNGAGYFRSFT